MKTKTVDIGANSSVHGCARLNQSTMAATLYEPVNVYKPLDADIGIVDGPFEYFTVAGIRMPMPFTTRMTVVRLGTGELFLHSPIAFDARLATELNTVSWASPGVRRRARARHIDVHFDRELEPAPPEDWDAEIDQTLVPGGIFEEFVFFHEASRTLILTDTIMNIDLDKVDEPWRTAIRLSGMHHPHGQVFFGMRIPLALQRTKTRLAVKKIKAWKPKRIVLSHGRCFDANAEGVVQRLLG